MISANQVIQNTMGFKPNFRVLTPENERPVNKKCRVCGCQVEPFLAGNPNSTIIKPRWVSREDICTPCKDIEDKKAMEASHKRLQQEKILKERKALELAFKASRISPRFKECVFETFVATPKNEKGFNLAKSFDPEKDEGILFYGSTGTGKTHLAASIVNKFMGKTNTLFISCPELLMEIRRSTFVKGLINSFDLAMQVPLLVVDDIGSEKPSEWVHETLFVLINHRYEHKLPTIFTSNFTIGQLSERLGDRISSRIAAMCRPVHVDGDDYRVKVRKQNI